MKTSQSEMILKKAGIECTRINTGSFDGFSSLYDYISGTAIFVNDSASAEESNRRIEILNSGKFSAVITTPWIYKKCESANVESFLIVDDPRLCFSIIANYDKPKGALIHPTSIIESCTSIGRDVAIGANSCIGSEGLSRNYLGDAIINTAHLGAVEIGDYVRIGCNCIIQRAVLGKTEIGDYSMIAHNSVIGHGVKIGKRVCISSNVTISGHAVINDDAWIGPNSVIKQGIVVGNKSFAGIGSVVIKSIPDNSVVAGNPARILENSKAPW